MRYTAVFRRTVSVCAALSGFALSVPMAHADFMSIESGDISCLGYNENTGDCASIQRARPLADGRVALVDETHIQIGELKFSVAKGFVARPEGGQLCVDPETVKVRAMPAGNKLAQEFALDAGVNLKMMALNGVCVEHKACGEDMLAEFYTDGEVVEGMTTRFRVFKKDDPMTAKIKPRAIGAAQIASLSSGGPFECDIAAEGEALQIQ